MDVDGLEGTPAAAAVGSSLEEAKAQVGFAVQLVNRALRGGEGPVLAPVLIRLLPSLIRIQVQSRVIEATGQETPETCWDCCFCCVGKPACRLTLK